MSLNPQVIGKTMPHGYAGVYARQPDMIVNTRPAGENIQFGQALVYNANGQVVLPAAGAKAADFVGVPMGVGICLAVLAVLVLRMLRPGSGASCACFWFLDCHVRGQPSFCQACGQPSFAQACGQPSFCQTCGQPSFC